MDYPSDWNKLERFVCALWRCDAVSVGLTEAESYAAFYARLREHLKGE